MGNRCQIGRSAEKQLLRHLRLLGVCLISACLLSVWLFCSCVAAADETDADADTDIYEASVYASQVTQYGMLPVYGRDIADGSYPVAAVTNSVYFKLHEPSLTVEGESMTVTFYIDSTSYTKVYMGSKADAASSAEDEQIQAQVEGDVTWFTIPVEALDTPVYCAAYSKRKKKWYGRQLLFKASSLPQNALSVDLPDYDLIDAAIEAYTSGEYTSVTAISSDLEVSSEGIGSEESGTKPDTLTAQNVFEDLSAVTVGGEDGEYSIEVVMTGGSGRASVSSPTYLTVFEGRAYATILWSSTHYDYMLLDGKKYLNEAADGGISRFTIPVTKLDEPIEIVADTTAMGDPVEITYTLTFYEETIGAKGLVPQEAARRVLVMASCIIIMGGVLNAWLKRRRRRRG